MNNVLIAVGILVLVVVVARYVFGRDARTGSSHTGASHVGRADRLYADLLTKARGDKALAERLINHEKKRAPHASRAELIKSAIYRWERDNR